MSDPTNPQTPQDPQNPTPAQPALHDLPEIDLPDPTPPAPDPIPEVNLETPPAGDTFKPVQEVNPDQIPPPPRIPVETPPEESTEAASSVPHIEEEETQTSSHEILPPYEPSKTVRQDHYTFIPLGEKEDLAELGVNLEIPADTNERVGEFIKGLPNEQVDETEKGAEWGVSLLRGRLAATQKDAQVESTQREGSAWRQDVKHGETSLSVARPRLAESEGAFVSGRKAVLKVRALMGLGTLVQIPLWHSGFWISLRSPSDGALLELYRRISDDKVQLGRRTSGWIFSNSSVYIAEHVLNFAMDHLWDSTLKDVENVADIRPLIVNHDIQTIAWGLACVLWPKGFGYTRAVLTHDGVAKPVIKERINISKLQFTDTAALTPWQIGHMAKRAGNHVTKTDLERYRKEFTIMQPREVALTEDGRVKVTLKVPNMDEYINNGHKWVAGVVSMVDAAFRSPENDEMRNGYIVNQSKSTAMRYYGHWVEKIVADDRTVNDQDSIDMVLDTMTEDRKVRTKFFEEVHRYIDDSTVSVIATPTVADSEEHKLPRFPHLVPIDALYVFFTLLTQKSTQLLNREE